MEYADFVEKCIKEYQENENEFIYQLIDPFCETVVEKTLSKKELEEILLKGMQKSIPLDKIKQAREEIDAECGRKGLDDYDYCSGLIFAKHVLDKLIESEGIDGNI